MVSLKKWQWLIASVLFVIVYSFYSYGDLSAKRIVNKVVYSSEDLLFMRTLLLNIRLNNDEQVAVSAHSSIEHLQTFETIERYNNGYLLSYEQPFVLNALYNGLVVFTGHTKYNGKSMSVLYDTGVTVTFGYVDEFYVLPYTTVTKGTILATKKTGKLYIQIEQDGNILNMEQTTKWLKDQQL